uniref:Uncharacterized protein n=1 Tax=Nostoc sp. PCC 9205 TaxID=2099383 RepID=A0A2P0ZGR1_9NOSO|nr:hypothetical protein [Nostoc sp. PCC 9205]
MQLLNATVNQSLTAISESLQTALEDIVNHLQIESNFCIKHPNYKPFEFPSDLVQRFQQVSIELKSKYQALQLQSFLYGIYYNASLRSTLALNTQTNHVELYKNLENDSFLGVDLAFYEQLHNSNCGVGYFDPGWQIVREEQDSSLAVFKEGLTLHIQREQHLQGSAQSAQVGDLVAIRLPRNLVQNGFYMAIGNQGIDQSQENNYADTVRIYFNVSPDGAVAIMQSLTQQLNQAEIPFSFKVLYNPSDYERYDSGVLYFTKQHYSLIRGCLQSIYAQHQSHFRAETPLFTKVLAPGLSLAEEPNRKFAAQESFGQNRCRIVANGLVDALQQGQTTPEGRMTAILEQFKLLGVTLQQPYLNADSEDVYLPLDLCE